MRTQVDVDERVNILTVYELRENIDRPMHGSDKTYVRNCSHACMHMATTYTRIRLRAASDMCTCV